MSEIRDRLISLVADMEQWRPTDPGCSIGYVLTPRSVPLVARDLRALLDGCLCDADEVSPPCPTEVGP